ncbi:MAG: hypothetical protein WD423_03495, partial [Rhodothermales bacterium]
TTAATPTATIPLAALRERHERMLQRRLLLELDDRTQGRLVVVFAGKSHPRTASDMAALREAGMTVVDATTDAIHPHMPPDSPIYFPYNQHWTEAAHRVVGELIGAAVGPRCETKGGTNTGRAAGPTPVASANHAPGPTAEGPAQPTAGPTVDRTTTKNLLTTP